MRYLRMVWRFATLDDRPMDADWKPVREPLPLLCRRDARAGHHYHYGRMGR